MTSGATIREATAGDQAFVTSMLYEALFVPPGATPFPRAVIDDEPAGAAWVRRLHGYGFVDDSCCEMLRDRRE